MMNQITLVCTFFIFFNMHASIFCVAEFDKLQKFDEFMNFVKLEECDKEDFAVFYNDFLRQKIVLLKMDFDVDVIMDILSKYLINLELQNFEIFCDVNCFLRSKEEKNKTTAIIFLLRYAAFKEFCKKESLKNFTFSGRIYSWGNKVQSAGRSGFKKVFNLIRPKATLI
ncbi:MAG: hypothetical protein UR26_C0004G0015 [candidate division TM6 bacterium GW2011_GWF2_32_72]|nr:MAG: hypothetical protein UR26_C0004G0015 [candidate division TM6 bacterium GW2011_GWF2_32_72]